MLGTWIDLPILDAVVRRITRRSAEMWFYLFVNFAKLPMHKNRVIKDLQMHKDVFSRCVKELEEFGLILYDPKSKTLDFASHAYNDSTTGLEIRGVGVAPLGERPKDGYE